MGEWGRAWVEASEYAANVAGVDEQAARDRGVPAARVDAMRTAVNLLGRGDPDAFYVVLCEHSSRGGKAVADLMRFRAESEAEREPTNPTGFVVPPEARGPTK